MESGCVCDLLQRSLDLHSLSPGNGRVGQAVAGVGPPSEVNALFVQVAEGLCHHLHGVVRQSRCVLEQKKGISGRKGEPG